MLLQDFLAVVLADFAPRVFSLVRGWARAKAMQMQPKSFDRCVFYINPTPYKLV